MDFYLLFLCAFLFSAIHVVVTTHVGQHSVNIRPQAGVTVTSAYLYRDGVKLPEWISNTFLLSKSNISLHGTCSFGFLGVCAPPERPQEFTPLGWLPLHSNSSNGNAYIFNYILNTRVQCVYRSVSQHWKKLERHFLLVFLCPIHSPITCKRISAHQRHSPRFLVYLQTFYDSSDMSRLWNNTFVLNTHTLPLAVPQRQQTREGLDTTIMSKKNTTQQQGTRDIMSQHVMYYNNLHNKRRMHDVVVCAAKTYGGNRSPLAAAHRALTWEWLHHYKVRGMTVCFLRVIKILVVVGVANISSIV